MFSRFNVIDISIMLSFYAFTSGDRVTPETKRMKENETENWDDSTGIVMPQFLNRRR
jgi:hypothetical protein